MTGATDCFQYRLAASAEMDGEDGSGLLVSLGLPPLDSHLASCSTCRSWVALATGVNRRMRVGLAESAPDLTGSILQAIAAEPVPVPLSQQIPGSTDASRFARLGTSRRRRRLIIALRFGLVIVAVGQVALAVPSLLFGEFAMNSAVHVARETGAWNVALAVGFAAAAVRPRLAAGLATVLGAFVVVVVLITAFDLGGANVHLDRAASHLIAMTGLALVIGMVRLASDRSGPTSASAIAHLESLLAARSPAPTSPQVAIPHDPWHAAA